MLLLTMWTLSFLEQEVQELKDTVEGQATTIKDLKKAIKKHEQVRI